MNLYEYASSNPVGAVDPSGSSILGEILGAIFLYCTDYRGIRPVARVIWRSELFATSGYGACWTGTPGLLLEGGGYPYGHCVWSCLIAKKHGEEQARECGRLKEALDQAAADLADSIHDDCWDKLGEHAAFAQEYLAGWACSAGQDSDDRDNEAGINCGTDECLKCMYDEKCRDCCSGAYSIFPDTPEGKESKGERPYGPRCTDRYKKALGELE